MVDESRFPLFPQTKESSVGLSGSAAPWIQPVRVRWAHTHFFAQNANQTMGVLANALNCPRQPTNSIDLTFCVVEMGSTNEGMECVLADGRSCRFVVSRHETSPVVFADDDRNIRELSYNLEKKQRHRNFFRKLARVWLAFKPDSRGRKMVLTPPADAPSQHTDQTVSTSSIETLPSDRDELIPLIEQRLWKTGIIQSADDFEFAPDFVSKEVVGLLNEDARIEHDETKSHVKTGVWEVQCYHNDGSPQDPFYVVTGVEMADRVDMKKLRKAIFPKPQSRRPSIRLAPTDIAETLTGFKSGTMMPICHDNMKLYLEESIIIKRQDPNHRVLCGSGMFGKCLSLSIDTFLRIAEANPKLLVVAPIIQKKRATKELP